MLKVFIKFNLTNENADALINYGEIFTNCAGYYIYQKQYKDVEGIGDEQEGLLLGIIRKGTDLPLYCMYEANEQNIVCENGKEYIKIDKRMIHYFASDKINDNTFFVVINSDYFILKTKEFKNTYDLRFGVIDYTKLSFQKQNELLRNNFIDRIMIKSPDYSYQQEVRLVIGDAFPNLSVNCKRELVYYMDGKQYKYNGKKYKIGDLKGYAIKLNTKDLIEIDKNHFGLEYSLIKEIAEISVQTTNN